MCRISVPIFLALLALSSLSSAQDDSLNTLGEQIRALTQSLKQLQSTVEQQQQRIETLEKENSNLKGSPSSAETVASAQQPMTNSAMPKSRNPDIGVVVDMVGSLTESRADEEGNDKASVREIEIIIGHDIDPYTRFDTTLSLSDFEDGVGIEEAYVTYLNLPWGLSTRLGRIKPSLGKANSLHRDQLDTVDEPLVIQRYLGAEGLSRTGIELSRFLPQFSDSFTQELTLGGMEGGIGEEGSLLGDIRRHPTLYAHLKNFLEVSPTTSLEFGNTLISGSSGEEERGDVQAYAIDLTAQHHFDSIRRLKWQTEFFLQDRDDVVVNDDAFGYYSLLDYRLNQRFGVGARYDNVERVAFQGEDEALSGYITFFQSEYARLRAQYQRIEFAEGGEDNRLMLQGTFTIGVHKHAIK